MKKYKVYLKQAGEGCDYTIGCGQKLITIEAENIEKATDKLAKIIQEDYSCDETKLEKVEMYEVGVFGVLDIANFYKQLEEMEQKKINLEKEKPEKIEYER